MKKMSGFIHIPQCSMDKRHTQLRKQDFQEIYQRFDPNRAVEQSQRCSQCGIPFCQIHCPLHNNIPEWLRLVAEERLEEAYEFCSETNTFPEICGRICPQDRLCEGNCVIEQAGHGAVTIGAVEQYITETAFDRGWVHPVVPVQEREQSVGIIGSGPAGLAAAEKLRMYGYQVTVYDRHDRPGGLLIYGIPSFKLDKHVVERRIRLLLQAQIRFQTDCDVGKTVSFEELRRKHDAILIAVGTYRAGQLNIFGTHLPNIAFALPYLISTNKRLLGDNLPISERINVEGKDVVVIGGGDTAMDCVRTAIREKARYVSCMYRRDRINMPGSRREIANAIEEGVSFQWLSMPEAFHGTKKVERVQALRVQLGRRDKTGRQTPSIIKDSSFDLPCDMAILALGFSPEAIGDMFDIPELKVDDAGRILVTRPTMMTSIKGVFAAGDIVRGADLVVWAIREGRDAALGIHSYLTQKLHNATCQKNTEGFSLLKAHETEHVV